MRIVIFGADQLIGSSIYRFMIKLRLTDEIVICTVSGDLPDGVVQRENIYQVDIRNKEDIRDIIQEGDIIYNGQVDISETNYSNPFGKISLHNQGLINLLGIANEKNAKRIITYIPAFLSWQGKKRPINEDTVQRVNDEIHHSFWTALETCMNYWNKSYYGYFSEDQLSDIQEFSEKENSLEKSAGEPAGEPAGGPAGKPAGKSAGGPAGGPAGEPTGVEKKSDSGISTSAPDGLAQSIAGSPVLGASKNLGEKGDTIPIISDRGENEGKSQKDSKDEVISDENHSDGVDPNKNMKPEQNIDKDSLKDLDEIKGGSTDSLAKGKETKSSSGENFKELDDSEIKNDKQLTKKESFRTKLIVIRGGRIFGPFEEELTPNLWKGVKTQRLEMYGSGKKKISWIHPEDIAIAMIQSSNFNLEGDYMVKSFDISSNELIKKMDEFNMSRTEIKKKSNFLESLKFFIRTLLTPDGLIPGKEFGRYFATDRGYIIDESKAKKNMKWAGQHPLETAIEESFNWFNNYYINKT